MLARPNIKGMSGRCNTVVVSEKEVGGHYKWSTQECGRAMGTCGSKVGEGHGYVVASLNILGALENPVEFLALNDEKFMGKLCRRVLKS